MGRRRLLLPDPLDDVAASCETVETVDIPPPTTQTQSITTQSTSDEPTPPAYLPSDVPKVADPAPDAAEDPNAPSSDEAMITAASSDWNTGYFSCWAPPVWRKQRYCDTVHVGNTAHLGFGVINTTPRRWVSIDDWVFYGCDGCIGWYRTGRAIVNEDFDRFDWTSYTYYRQTHYGYAEASSAGDSSAYKWTHIDKGRWTTHNTN